MQAGTCDTTLSGEKRATDRSHVYGVLEAPIHPELRERLETSAAAILARAGIPVDQIDESHPWTIDIAQTRITIAIADKDLLSLVSESEVPVRMWGTVTLGVPANLLSGGTPEDTLESISDRFETEAKLVEYVLAHALAIVSPQLFKRYTHARNRLMTIRSRRMWRFRLGTPAPVSVLRWADIESATHGNITRVVTAIDEQIEREQLLFWLELRERHRQDFPPVDAFY